MIRQMMRLNLATAKMMGEAQTVIGLRMLGMTGMLPASGAEGYRMVAEKQTAFAQAGVAATQAIWRGGSAMTAMEAALAPISRTTNANSRRLTRSGR